MPITVDLSKPMKEYIDELLDGYIVVRITNSLRSYQVRKFEAERPVSRDWIEKSLSKADIAQLMQFKGHVSLSVRRGRGYTSVVLEKRAICDWCSKPKSGTKEGLCSHCGRFGKVKNYADTKEDK